MTSDEELVERGMLRTEIIIEQLGICAYFYELIMDIIIEEVIGWDVEKQGARSEGGFFGMPLALTATTEEQGRTTLYTHFQLWIQGFQKTRENLYSNNQRERKSAENCIIAAIDRVSSCQLYDPTRCPENDRALKVFPHNCRETIKKRKMPAVVCDQELRALQHQRGIEETHGRFADCLHCSYSWTNEELIESYLIN